MRSQVIPAQITTVEDKIAGNLSLTQLMLLLQPVLVTSLMYVLLPPSMSFVLYKVIGAVLFSVFCVTLAVRYKERIVAEWLIMLIRYNTRPKYYVYNKNSVAFRRIIKPEVKVAVSQAKKPVHSKDLVIEKPPVKDFLQFRQMLDSANFNLTYRSSSKGGLNVAFEKISQ